MASNKKHNHHEHKIKPFNPTNLQKLKFLIIVVKKGHGVATNQLLLDNGVSMTTTLYGEGTKERYVMDIFGGEERNKECILAIVNANNYEKIKEKLDIRFTISQASKGSLIAIDVDSMAGVLAYKFISDFGGSKNYGTKK